MQRRASAAIMHNDVYKALTHLKTERADFQVSGS